MGNTFAIQYLTNRECHVPLTIEIITGINGEELQTQPLFSEVVLRIKELLQGAVFVAHNARFDYSFIKAEFTGLDDTYSAKYLCSVRLSKKFDTHSKHHDLSTLIDRGGLTCKKAPSV